MQTQKRALGYQQITDVSVAVGLTIPAGTSYALIQCEDANVRWRDDGTDPTAAVGMLLAQGQELLYDAMTLPGLRFIEEVATATLNISYYGS